MINKVMTRTLFFFRYSSVNPSGRWYTHNLLSKGLPLKWLLSLLRSYLLGHFKGLRLFSPWCFNIFGENHRTFRKESVRSFSPKLRWFSPKVRLFSHKVRYFSPKRCDSFPLLPPHFPIGAINHPLMQRTVRRFAGAMFVYWMERCS